MSLTRIFKPPRLRAASRRCLVTSNESNESSDLVYASKLETPTAELPDKAKVVICGGGAQGAAIAYKLAQRGLGEGHSYSRDPLA